MKILLLVERVQMCQMVLLAAWFDILMLYCDAFFSGGRVVNAQMDQSHLPQG